MRLTSGNAGLRCEYCKTVVALAPGDDDVEYLDEAPGLLCPACASSLWNAVQQRVPVNLCKRCHGLLVGMSALGPLVEAMRATHPGSEIPAPANPADLEPKIVCPQCHQRMDMEFYAGGGNVAVASCERCELNWLEGGALMHIVRAPQLSDADLQVSSPCHPSECDGPTESVSDAIADGIGNATDAWREF
jgi:Zn-finger nucleic acid-binding protein